MEGQVFNFSCVLTAVIKIHPVKGRLSKTFCATASVMKATCIFLFTTCERVNEPEKSIAGTFRYAVSLAPRIADGAILAVV